MTCTFCQLTLNLSTVSTCSENLQQGVKCASTSMIHLPQLVFQFSHVRPKPLRTPEHLPFKHDLDAEPWGSK